LVQPPTRKGLIFKGVGPQNGWGFIMEKPNKIDDLEVPLFLETPILYILGGGFMFCSSLFGEDEPILRSIFFKWVETTN